MSLKLKCRRSSTPLVRIQKIHSCLTERSCGEDRRGKRIVRNSWLLFSIPPHYVHFQVPFIARETLARAFISGNLMHGRKVRVVQKLLPLSRSILDFSWRFSFPLFERLVGCPSAAAKYKKKMGMYKSVGNGLMSRKAHNSFSHCYYCCSYTAPPYVPKIHRRVMLKPELQESK